MRRFHNLVLITLADFIVRSAYQMGKTPLLPIFAASLGATDVLLGLIVSVSTFTGMILKPLIGLLSDFWGRRIWLLTGTGFFTIIPFAYSFVHTPEQLFTIRIVHGLATAIYGPVTLAYVAEEGNQHCAERIGWFGVGRTTSYIVGPLLAGWLLLTQEPQNVFTIIGIFSSLAFIPVLFLSEANVSSTIANSSLRHSIRATFSKILNLQVIWIAGTLEMIMYIALYGVKTFLPVHGVSVGISVAMIGGFFAIQEGVHLLLKPWAGRLGDRFSYLVIISIGLAILSVAILLVTFYENRIIFVISALIMGCSQALINPSTIALVSHQIMQSDAGMGVGMGTMGTLKNMGKIAGPILVGLILTKINFTQAFYLMSVTLLIMSGVFWHYSLRHADQGRNPSQRI